LGHRKNVYDDFSKLLWKKNGHLWSAMNRLIDRS
jgi:hypothetical protein